MFATFAPSPSSRLLASILLCHALASAALAGNVHTVGGTGGDFPDIASAVAAAASGDVILVRSGSYPGFLIETKSLSIVAESSMTVNVTSRVNVRSITEGQRVVLAGLHLVAPGTGVYESFLANYSVGSIRLQSCEIGRQDMQIGVGARLVECRDVALVGCTVQGAMGYDFVNGGAGGYRGLWSSTSSIALYDCDIHGGDGQDGGGGDGYPGGIGGEACFLDGVNFLFASGTAFRGGDGGEGSSAADCFDEPAGEGGDGGVGIRDAGSAHIVLLPYDLSGGAAGRGGHEGCGFPPDDGVPGSEIVLSAESTLDELPGSARRLVLPSPVRESTPIPISLTGQPGELAYLTLWGDTRFLYLPAYSGVQLEKSPLVRRLRVGTVPASGVLNANIVLPDLGAGVEGKNWFFQAYFLDAASTVRLASPGFVVTLDSAF